MKHLATFLICAIVIIGCNKEKYGSTKLRIKATTNSNDSKLKSSKTGQELRYTQFGNYITSLTPTSFVGEISMARFVNDSIESDHFNSMTLVNRQNGEAPLNADFSNNATIDIVPVLNGSNSMTNADGAGAFFKDDVTFRMLMLSMELKQIITLPEAYTNVSLKQFEGSPEQSTKQGNILTTRLSRINQVLGIPALSNNGMNIYFGMTNSTFFNYSPLLSNVPLYHIRSSNYTDWTMTPPKPDQTKTYLSTIGFVNDYIIQIYTGKDNIPYTSDDIIVMEPKFWERIYITVNEI